MQRANIAFDRFKTWSRSTGSRCEKKGEREKEREKKRLEAGLVFWMKKEKRTGAGERVGDGISRTKKERERDTKREQEK